MCRFVVIKKRSLVIGALLLCFMLAGGAAIYAMTGGEKVRLPIIMYHSILKNPSSAGKYVISPDVLETDMKYLSENGYTTVLGRDVINYVKRGEPLPEKPIMLTFDDGYLNNLTYALPLLEKYDMKAVISVVGEYSERFSENDDHNPSYSHLSWEEIKQCVASGRIEIGNHTYNMHMQGARRGSMKKKDESEAEYKTALINDITKAQKLLEENCGIVPTIFTYPYGAVSNASLNVIKEMGFEMSFGCCEQVNELARDEETLYLMCRFNRPSGISTENFMHKLEE